MGNSGGFGFAWNSRSYWSSPEGSFKGRAKGMADVAVKLGRSALFIGVGVAMFGGRNLTGSLMATATGVGPSGWYRTNLSGVPGRPFIGLEGSGTPSGSGDSQDADMGLSSMGLVTGMEGIF